MYKIINVKDFQTCNNNMSVAEPRNQAEEVLSKCTSMITTTFPLIVPGRVQSSMQTTGQSTMCMAMTITSTKRWGEVETCIERKTASGFRQWQWSVFQHRQSDYHKFDQFVEDHHERQIRNCYAKHLHQLRCVQFWETAARNLEIIPMITHTKCVGRHCNTVRVSRALWTVSITKLGWNTSTCLLGSFVTNSCPVHAEGFSLELCNAGWVQKLEWWG